MYPVCPNAVAFLYTFAEHEPQYQPYTDADVNVDQSIDCETAMSSTVAVDLVAYENQFASANLFIVLQYRMLKLKQVEEQTIHQADNQTWHMAKNYRLLRMT